MNQTLIVTVLIALVGLNVFTLVEVNALRGLIEAQGTPQRAVETPKAAQKAQKRTEQLATLSKATLGLESSASLNTAKTSKVKAKTPRERCHQVCNALGNCALEPEVCSAASTTTDHEVRSGCVDACQVNEKLVKDLELAANCQMMTKIARSEIQGFASLCGSEDRTP